MPKVSIIVPVYNAEVYLTRCIDSILAQTYTDFELILVDDGSKDGSLSICDEYAKMDKRIVVIHQNNMGVSSARNTGLSIASGEDIVFCDSDDMVKPYYLSQLVQHNEIDFVTAGFEQEDIQHCWNHRRFNETKVTIQEVREDPQRFFGKHYFGAPWAKKYKKLIISENNIQFDTNVNHGEDTLFILKYLTYCHTMAVVNDCGYLYHYYKNSLVRNIDDDYFKYRIKIANEVRSFFSPDNTEGEMFLNEYIFRIYLELVSRYRDKWSEIDLYLLYVNPVFAKSIEYKKLHGLVGEKIFLIFCSKKMVKLYYRVRRWIKKD